MPIYEYEEIATGKVVERFATIEGRDVPVTGFRRLISRPSASVNGFNTAIKEDTVFAQVPKALKEMDSNHFSRFQKQSGFTVDQIRKAWSKPVPKSCRDKWS